MAEITKEGSVKIYDKNWRQGREENDGDDDGNNVQNRMKEGQRRAKLVVTVGSQKKQF